MSAQLDQCLFSVFFKVSNVTKCSKVCSFQGQGQILTEGLTGLWCICWYSGFVLSLFLLSFLILYQLYQPTGMKDNRETWHTKQKGHRWLHIFMLQRNDSRCLWQCGCITHPCQMFHNKATFPVIVCIHHLNIHLILMTGFLYNTEELLTSCRHRGSLGKKHINLSVGFFPPVCWCHTGLHAQVIDF